MRIATLMVVLLAGCATSGGELTEARGSWDGATYDEVVLRWGTPVRSTKLTDGRDVYTWVSESVGSRGASPVDRHFRRQRRRNRHRHRHHVRVRGGEPSAANAR